MIFFTFLHSWNFVSCFIWLFTSLLSSVARLKLYFSLKIPFSPKNFCRLLYVSPLEKKTLYLYPLPYILKYCIISTQYLALAHTSTTEPCSTPVPTLALYLLLHLYSSLSSLYIFIFFTTMTITYYSISLLSSNCFLLCNCCTRWKRGVSENFRDPSLLSGATIG